MPGIEQPEALPASAASDAVLEQIRDALRDLKFGTVTVIVQDGVVVQLERTEKHRLRRPGN
jgi:hypothetical protein